MSELGDFDAQRRRILRRITLLTWGLWGAAAALAVAGGALLAWMFSAPAGLPFTTLWLIITAGLVAVPAVLHLAARFTERRRMRRAQDQNTREGRDRNGG